MMNGVAIKIGDDLFERISIRMQRQIIQVHGRQQRPVQAAVNHRPEAVWWARVILRNDAT